MAMSSEFAGNGHAAGGVSRNGKIRRSGSSRNAGRDCAVEQKSAPVPIEDGTFLVVGGAGFIGSHTVDRLLAEGAAQVRVLDDFSHGDWRGLEEAGRTGQLKLIRGDIRDAKTVIQSMEGVDGVFHLTASWINHGAGTPRLTVEVLLDGTFNVLEAALIQSVKKVVYGSSAMIYGSATTFPIPEDHHPYDNRNFAGVCKLAGEGMLRSFYDSYGLEYVALRYFNVYGPRMDASGINTEAIIRWLDAIARQEQPVIFGDGRQTLDLIDVQDVAEANLLAMRGKATDISCNIGGGEEIALNDLVHLMIELTGSSMQPIYQAPREEASVDRLWADTGLARERLAFQPRVGLREGLQRLIEWRQQWLPALPPKTVPNEKVVSDRGWC